MLKASEREEGVVALTFVWDPVSDVYCAGVSLNIHSFLPMGDSRYRYANPVPISLMSDASSIIDITSIKFNVHIRSKLL